MDVHTLLKYGCLVSGPSHARSFSGNKTLTSRTLLLQSTWAAFVAPIRLIWINDSLRQAQVVFSKFKQKIMILNRLFRIRCVAQRTIQGCKSHQQLSPPRSFSFSFVGPKTLEDILKKDLMAGKSATEVADIWFSYHENKVRTYCDCLSEHSGRYELIVSVSCLWIHSLPYKICMIQVTFILFFLDICVHKENVHGLVYKGKYAKSILKRAAERYVLKSLVWCFGGGQLLDPR